MMPLFVLLCCSAALAHVKLYYQPNQIPIRNALNASRDGTFSVTTDGCGNPNTTFGHNGVTKLNLGSNLTLFFDYGTSDNGDHASPSNRFRIAMVDLDSGAQSMLLNATNPAVVLVSGIDASAGSRPAPYVGTITLNKLCARCVVAAIDQRNWGGCYDISVVASGGITLGVGTTTTRITTASTASTPTTTTATTTATTTTTSTTTKAATTTITTTKATTAAPTTTTTTTTTTASTTATTAAPTTATTAAPTTCSEVGGGCRGCVQSSLGCKFCPVAGRVGCQAMADSCGGSLRTVSECEGNIGTSPTTGATSSRDVSESTMPTTKTAPTPSTTCRVGTLNCVCTLYDECGANLTCKNAVCVPGDNTANSVAAVALSLATALGALLALVC